MKITKMHLIRREKKTKANNEKEERIPQGREQRHNQGQKQQHSKERRTGKEGNGGRPTILSLESVSHSIPLKSEEASKKGQDRNQTANTKRAQTQEIALGLGAWLPPFCSRGLFK